MKKRIDLNASGLPQQHFWNTTYSGYHPILEYRAFHHLQFHGEPCRSRRHCRQAGGFHPHALYSRSHQTLADRLSNDADQQYSHLKPDLQVDLRLGRYYQYSESRPVHGAITVSQSGRSDPRRARRALLTAAPPRDSACPMAARLPFPPAPAPDRHQRRPSRHC